MLRILAKFGSYIVSPATAACEADHEQSESPNGDGVLIQNVTLPVEISLPPLVEGPVTVLDSLHLAFCDLAEGREHFKDRLASTKFAFMLNTTPEDETRRTESQAHPSCFVPGKYGDIASFCTALNRVRRKFPQANLVICTGNHADAVAHSTFLAASYLLLWEESTLDQALSVLRPVSAPISASMAAALRAVHQARYLASTRLYACNLCVIMFFSDIARNRCLNWINLHADAEAPSGKREADRIFLDEYFHYDDPRNASMHVLVPGKLLVFTRPVDIGPTTIPGICERPVTWMDVDNQPRRFSPEYFAEIFEDWEVKLVLRCNPSSYDLESFTARGIGAEEFSGLDCNMNLFQHMDRLVTLSRLSRGYMAFECGDEGLGHAEVLVVAYLMRMYQFDAEAALAWVQLMHPGSERPGLRFSLKFSEGLLRPGRSLTECDSPSDNGLLRLST